LASNGTHCINPKVAPSSVAYHTYISYLFSEVDYLLSEKIDHGFTSMVNPSLTVGTPSHVSVKRVKNKV